jgi:hypothetical protein
MGTKEQHTSSLFRWLVADGWCWFVLREEYCWLVAGGWFVLREKYCWLVADKPSEQAPGFREPREKETKYLVIMNGTFYTFQTCVMQARINNWNCNFGILNFSSKFSGI